MKKHKRMTSFAAILFAVIFTLTLTGCDDEPPPPVVAEPDTGTLPPPPPEPSRVGPVINLTAAAASGEVTLSWTNPQSATFDYTEIFFSPDIDGIGQPITVSRYDTQKRIAGLRNGETYIFTVTAFDASGNKSDWRSVSITPRVPGTEAIPDTVPPEPVEPAPISVQDALRNAQIAQAAPAQFTTAIYDEDLGCVLLAYKVGTITNMFLQYLSDPVIAGPGRTFTYTQSRGSIEAEQTEYMNMTTSNISGSVAGAFAGASAYAAAGAIVKPDGVAGPGAAAKASAYAVAGKVSFDLTSVTKTTYTQTYIRILQTSQSLTQDTSIFPAGRKYAVAAFADVGVYQFLKYNIADRTAVAIPGKSMWFNIESKPAWGIYEYNEAEELSLPSRLTPFERLNVQVNENDLYKALKTYHTETSTNDLDDVSSSRAETVNPTLIVPLLKHFGYQNVRIDVQFRYKKESILSGGLRLQIASAGRTSLYSRDASRGTDWGDGPSVSATVNIDSLNSATGTFMLLWSKTGTAEYCVGRRTFTITALK